MKYFFLLDLEWHGKLGVIQKLIFLHFSLSTALLPNQICGGFSNKISGTPHHVIWWRAPSSKEYEISTYFQTHGKN